MKKTTHLKQVDLAAASHADPRAFVFHYMPSQTVTPRITSDGSGSGGDGYDERTAQGGCDGSLEQKVTGEQRPQSGGASPGYRLRRCDEEHGQRPCSESIGQPVLGPTKRRQRSISV